jgi:hypothetical protein
MITIEADFNHRDERGRLLLADLAMHRGTPFAAIATRASVITFVDGEDAVSGSLELDPVRGWVGTVDWSSAESVEAWPVAASSVNGRGG